MSKLTHKIAPEVRADIIRRIKEEGVPVSQAAKEHGITESAIYHWLGATVKGQPSWTDLARLQKQVKDYLEIIGELTVRLSVAQKKN